MAPPGRQKSEREFCLFGGVFCARRAAPCAGLAVLALPAAVAAACVPDISAGAPLPCSRPARRFSAAFTQTFAPVCLACAAAARHALCARSSVLFWLSVCLFRVGCTRVFLLSFIFCLFLFGFDLSNFFSFVAQAATGISLLVSSCGFVPGLRAAYLFLPDPCCRNLPAMRFVCAVPSCFGCLFACSTLFARAFFSYLSPFPVWLLPLKLLFICRSGRDGDFLACPLPWLCSRPAGLVTCCFFADLCAHCLFACRALCFGCLFICLCCLRGFSLLFFIFSCLTFSSQTSFHLSLRPRRGFPRLSPPVALFPARGSCHLLLFRGLLRPLPVCLPCALFWLFVHLSVLFARVFSLVFHLFLPNFFLSNFFSFVAQAATGLYFLPKRK